MIICFSGTPGTGKTTLAKKLFKVLKENKTSFSKRYNDIIFYDNEKVIKEYPTIFVDYDEKKDTKIIDESLLTDFFNKIKSDEKIIIFDSHLSIYLNPNIVDYLFITKANIKNLRNRLKKRSYNKDKIEENIQSEIFDICYVDSKELNHKNVYKINTDKSIKESFKEIKNILVN